MELANEGMRQAKVGVRLEEIVAERVADDLHPTAPRGRGKRPVSRVVPLRSALDRLLPAVSGSVAPLAIRIGGARAVPGIAGGVSIAMDGHT